MKIDPETGALTSSRWTLDPREPQSSFAGWARAAGFSGGYHAEADGWFVNVFFDTFGTLRRVSMSMGLHDDHERWVGEQRWRGRVYADWDRHYSDSNVYLEWDTAVSDGPPPEPGDLDVIAHAARLDLAPVGDDWELTPAYLAFERLARQPPSDDDLAAVLQNGTAAGRCYAAHLAPQAWSTLVDDTSPLSVGNGVLSTVGSYARVRVLAGGR